VAASGIDGLDQDPVDLPGKRGLQLIKAQEERRLSVQFQEAGKVEAARFGSKCTELAE
jgi:hypothetical protein